MRFEKKIELKHSNVPFLLEATFLVEKKIFDERLFDKKMQAQLSLIPKDDRAEYVFIVSCDFTVAESKICQDVDFSFSEDKTLQLAQSKQEWLFKQMILFANGYKLQLELKLKELGFNEID